ncbi:MAG TPA: hypothetical protein VHP12_03910 [Chitinophagaceae bacterium]|nr:hypothetical protein [Chitinophagaceae bacterium]
MKKLQFSLVTLVIMVFTLSVFTGCQEKDKKKEEAKKEEKTNVGFIVAVDAEGIAHVFTDSTKLPASFHDTLSKYNICPLASISIDGKAIDKNADSALTAEIKDWENSKHKNDSIKTAEKHKCDSIYKAESDTVNNNYNKRIKDENDRHNARVGQIGLMPNGPDKTKATTDENSTYSKNKAHIDVIKDVSKKGVILRKKNCDDAIANSNLLIKPKKLTVNCALSKLCAGKKCELAKMENYKIDNKEKVKITFHVDVSDVSKLDKGASYFCTCGLK